MDKISLIENLITELNEVNYGQDEKLDAVKRNAEMIIRNIFGQNHKYLQDLSNIHFYPMVYPSSDNIKKSAWNKGIKKLNNLYQTIKKEITIFNPNCQNSGNMDVSFQSKRVFIVHGHDESMKQSVARTIEKIGLEPIILHEKPNEGNTIIEKFTKYSDVNFAIVLLSPDDIAYPKDSKEGKKKYRARQNVILELGYFLGKLGRNKTMALYKPEENFEMPSDYSGVLFLQFELNGRWEIDLIRELKACGYDVDANSLISKR